MIRPPFTSMSVARSARTTTIQYTRSPLSALPRAAECYSGRKPSPETFR